MSHRILYLVVVCLSIPTLHAETFIGRGIKKWFYTSFGIDINEPFVNKPFNPTLENLNAVTLIPADDQYQPEDTICSSVSELAQTIDQQALPEQALLVLTDKATGAQRYWHVTSGLDAVQHNEPVFVYSRGYAGADKPAASSGTQKRGMCAIPKQGGGVVVCSQWLKGQIINGPCVVFDYPDTRSYFDFGLNNDKKCLDLIYGTLQEKTDSIVLFGNCRGAKALLTFLSRSRPQEVKAVILDAPFMDLEQFTQEISKNYGRRLPFTQLIAKKIITKWYPHYRKKDDLTYSDLKRIPKHIPIFIGHLKKDTLVSDKMMQHMVKTLRDSGHTVYLLVVDDTTKSHSRLYQTKPFQQATNAFLKKHNLPHDAELAQEGHALLGQAKHTALNVDKWKSGFVHVVKA